MRGPWAVINCAAYKHNLSRIKTFTPKSNLLAMIKSNAYGHGAIYAANALSAADGFGVSSLAEAVHLRNHGITRRILVLAGYYSIDDLRLAAEQHLEITIHQHDHLCILEKTNLTKPITVWVKINTGMNRLGFLPAEVANIYQRLKACHNVNKFIHLMTHLADADDIEKVTTKAQLACFKQATADLDGPRSIANSASILAWPETHAAWNRPGIMLYGISPLPGCTGKDHGLQPVMTLTARLAAINFIRKDSDIGYGGAWKCPIDNMPVGVVAIGYGDGYPRNAISGTPTLIHKKNCPLIGRVSMDLITVDLRNCPEARVGDEVTLWGNDLPIETIAKHSDTIAYELTCRLTQRVQFIEA